VENLERLHTTAVPQPRERSKNEAHDRITEK
jgi:hypothetical protein